MAAAEPIKLKLSFFTSDRSNIYQAQIKPFVDAVNADGKGLVEIEVYFSGAISNVQNQQPQLVADGTADIALIVPGQAPKQFPDGAVMELAGVFRDAREASSIFYRLIEAKALKGYEDYVVIGTFVSEGESIHSRKPLGSLADLKGQTIRTNNRMEAAALEKLGAIPVLIPINQTTEAISRGKIDGATIPPAMLFEFGIGRVTNHHYMMHLGGAPTAIVMNAKKFASLPPAVQAIIRKYSGEWLSKIAVTAMDLVDETVLAELKANPKRTVIYPSQPDLGTIKQTYNSVVEQWAAADKHNRQLLDMVEAKLLKHRSAQ